MQQEKQGESQVLQAVLLALGTNTKQENLSKATQMLANLGCMKLSDDVSGADFTKKSRRIYHNVCVKITLHQPMNLNKLKLECKKIEKKCGRDDKKKTKAFDYEVAMDIDLLAYKTQHQWQLCFEKSSGLKNHEIQGLTQLMGRDFLDGTV